ncbi:heavy metal translocating P-type ATPase [Cellvibrio sp. PSBB006]|uniref:heavy metal translocating P-type ATPase n=1 Tax=Cellvibrio sp. PSBB006 TaxID=1987723 RepID=UPI000B3B7A93|nr:heavy metal translocating P-type ATPase [Cellvibrio sp. PSBB006]ARU27387.1 ATPase [Cellvibrio sp. PSBB006]
MPASDTPLACYHCGLPVPADAHFPVTIAGKDELMCCPGCQAVAMAIVDGGLANFYRFRTENSARPASGSEARQAQWSIYDLPEVQADFVVELDAEHQRRQANVLLEGISCAACSWLIETHLKKQPAVQSVTINITTHRCTLIWDAQQQPLSELLAALSEIGYKPRPATDEQQQDLVRTENRMALFRLGVAGFGMMQAMMVAVGMYTGATDAWLSFLRWQSFLAATPVVFFSCWPFFKSAWRSIKSRHLVMDVPVALAIGLAYIASGWATIAGGGEVYFESISMFAFFLLLGRYVEMRARHRNRLAFGNLAQLMPLSACCLTEQEGKACEQQVPLKTLRPGDRVLVKAGETFPCDGLVESGESSAVEAILTGESNPVTKRHGDTVIAGTLNSDSPLVISVTATGAATQLSAIERLAAQAAEEKPAQVTVADRIARFFIARLLVVCALVFAFWWWYDPARALWVTLSVLVVTCPCALALAMPAALSATTANLRKQGFLVARGHVVETLTQISRVIFDKTGTLTKGQFVVVDVRLCRQSDQIHCLAIAAALEASANHPLALAFRHLDYSQPASQVKQMTGAGVEGEVAQVRYRLGTLDFVSALFPSGMASPVLPDTRQQWLLLGDNQGPLAWIALEDEVRPGAAEVVAAFQREGIAVELLSGDQSGAVAALAGQLGIRDFIAGAKPEDKLSHLHRRQAQGDKVLMLGDGINDVPILSGADISIAMASASDLAQTRADAVLLNDNLPVLHNAVVLAHRTKRIIQQNLRFSLTYNLLALPLAAAGWVAPWQAAIGMTASSLIVIFNSLRLSDSSDATHR